MASGINYPPIKVYVNYRTPLVSLEVDGIASIRSRNVIISNRASSFSIAVSGSGTAILDLDHGSDINVAVSGTSRVTLSGRVQGNGILALSGIPELNAFSCPMNTIQVSVSGGTAYVNGVGIHATVSGIGVVCYKGKLLSQQVSGLGSVSADCSPEQTPPTPEPTPKPTLTTPEPLPTDFKPSSAESGKIMSEIQRLMVILVTIVVFLFIEFIIN